MRRPRPFRRALYLTLIMMLIWLLLMWLFSSAHKAHSDVGGEVPSPGLCEYPGVGVSSMINNVYTYSCDFPTEINGSHWHCELAGAALQAAITAGVNIAFLSVGGSLSGNVGGIGGSCSFRCPDSTLAATPNPPGAWKSYINPSRCQTIGPAPTPPGEPAPAPPPAPPPLVGPAVTDPVAPNPAATVNGNQ